MPHFGDEGSDATHGGWRRVAERVGAQPRRVWIGAALLLLVFSAGTLNFSDGLTSGNAYREKVESVKGQELISRSFPGGANAPADIVVPPGDSADAVAQAVTKAEGVAGVSEVTGGERGTLLAAVLEPEPYSKETRRPSR